jgi:ABC-2 type transport system ATP-binding protein
MSLIEVSNVSRVFGEVVAVDGVSLSVAAGEIYGLVGPDGAGKTTTLRLLCGAYMPTAPSKVGPSGEIASTIRISGFDVVAQPERAREKIGYLPQRFSLYEDLTVIENIRFFAEARGLSPAEWRPRCLEILEFVGLDQFVDRRAGLLSGGMKQKLGLAAALVHRPLVLLLDEPTTGVDPVTRQDFWQLIIRLVSQNGDEGRATAVLVSTPYMDEAARCTRVGFMSRGRLVMQGTPSELCATLEGRIIELFGEPLTKLRRLVEAEQGVEGVQMFGDRLHLRVGPGQADQVIARLQERIPEHGMLVSRMRIVDPQLEDIFMGLLGAET